MARNTAYRSSRQGFTLIEILIVVIILGILAAIVIPQFSSASNDARKSNVQTTVQTLRSQIALYKLQHQDTLPDLVTNWDQITKKTDASGSTSPAAGVQTFGPYMQETPVNSLNGKSTVANGDGSAAASTAVGFVYDYAAGAGSGKIFGTDVDGKTIIK
ncbi:MAG TPA: prepilin-type N-terminal cleavage/methylation domain-containing protein [Humisphaera sp.]